MKLRQLTPLLSNHNRFRPHWNGIETAVSSFKSVSPRLERLIDREINTYKRSFISFREPGFCLKQAKDSLQPSAFVRETLFAEESPLGSTALVTAVEIPSNVRLETSRLGPKMTGPTKTEGRRGMILYAKHSYLRHRAFPRSPEAPRTSRGQ